MWTHFVESETLVLNEPLNDVLALLESLSLADVTHYLMLTYYSLSLKDLCLLTTHSMTYLYCLIHSHSLTLTRLLNLKRLYLLTHSRLLTLTHCLMSMYSLRSERLVLVDSLNGRTCAIGVT